MFLSLNVVPKRGKDEAEGFGEHRKNVSLQRMCQHHIQHACPPVTQLTEGSNYSVNRDSYIIMVNITVDAATGKTAYAISFDPDGANTDDLSDGNFATCISTDAETAPW